jgi:hypothetical protein
MGKEAGTVWKKWRKIQGKVRRGSEPEATQASDVRRRFGNLFGVIGQPTE